MIKRTRMEHTRCCNVLQIGIPHTQLSNPNNSHNKRTPHHIRLSEPQRHPQHHRAYTVSLHTAFQSSQPAQHHKHRSPHIGVVQPSKEPQQWEERTIDGRMRRIAIPNQALPHAVTDHRQDDGAADQIDGAERSRRAPILRAEQEREWV